MGGSCPRSLNVSWYTALANSRAPLIVDARTWANTSGLRIFSARRVRLALLQACGRQLCLRAPPQLTGEIDLKTHGRSLSISRSRSRSAATSADRASSATCAATSTGSGSTAPSGLSAGGVPVRRVDGPAAAEPSGTMGSWSGGDIGRDDGVDSTPVACGCECAAAPDACTVGSLRTGSYHPIPKPSAWGQLQPGRASAHIHRPAAG